MPSSTPHRQVSTTEPELSSQSLGDDYADLRRALEDAIRSAKELRQGAEHARRDHDGELAEFFERCALTDEARSTEAKELFGSRTRLSASEIPTSAAFAAGDGANDADVSPNSQRGKVGVWPAL